MWIDPRTCTFGCRHEPVSRVQFLCAQHVAVVRMTERE
jgi:hypothetical protein